MDVASIEAGTLTLDLKEVSPEALVQNAVESCLPLAASVSVRLEAEVASGLQLVQADEDRVQQALGNLLNNAIKCRCSLLNSHAAPIRYRHIIASPAGDDARPHDVADGTQMTVSALVLGER